MSINDLSRASTPVQDADLFVAWPVAAQDEQVVTAAQLLAYIQSKLTSNLALTQQFAAPSSTGFNIAMTSIPVSPSTWLVLTPTGTLAAGTITLPLNPADGQVALVNTTQTVTALTVAGNGRTVTGAPTTLAANGFFEMRYSATFSAWYRTG